MIIARVLFMMLCWRYFLNAKVYVIFIVSLRSEQLEKLQCSLRIGCHTMRLLFARYVLVVLHGTVPAKEMHKSSGRDIIAGLVVH
jgi:hypothetical protein